MPTDRYQGIANNFETYAKKIEDANDLGAYQRVVAGDIGLQKNRYKNLSEFKCKD